MALPYRLRLMEVADDYDPSKSACPIVARIWREMRVSLTRSGRVAFSYPGPPAHERVQGRYVEGIAQSATPAAAAALIYINDPNPQTF